MKEQNTNVGGKSKFLNSTKKILSGAVKNKFDHDKSPKRKDVEIVFENMKQQIIEGGESPLIPHKMDDRFRSPEPKREKSKTPII